MLNYVKLLLNYYCCYYYIHVVVAYIAYQVGRSCSVSWPGLENKKLKAYALLMSLLIGRLLSWEFCSAGTTCMRIKTSHISCYILSCCVDELIMLNVVKKPRSGDFV